MPPRKFARFFSNFNHWFNNEPYRATIPTIEKSINDMDLRLDAINVNQMEDLFNNSSAEQRAEVNRILGQVESRRQSRIYEAERQAERDESDQLAAAFNRSQGVDRQAGQMLSREDLRLQERYDRIIAQELSTHSIHSIKEEERQEANHPNSVFTQATNLQQGIADWGHVYDQWGSVEHRNKQDKMLKKSEATLKKLKSTLIKQGHNLPTPIKNNSKRMQGPPPPPPDPFTKKQNNSRKIFILDVKKEV